MPFLSPASVVHNIMSVLSRRKPKRSHQQEEDPLVDNPSSEAVSLLNEISDKLQSSPTWSPPANTGGWESHPFVAWLEKQHETKGDGWLRLGLFRKKTGMMRLVEKVFIERIHAALFKNCSSKKRLHKLLNNLMRCAMGVSSNGWSEHKLFPAPPNIPVDMESPSESEEEEQQDGDGGPTSPQADGRAALPPERIDGGEDNTASESNFLWLSLRSQKTNSTDSNVSSVQRECDCVNVLGDSFFAQKASSSSLLPAAIFRLGSLLFLLDLS
jgi:hypothetical protein